MPLNIDETAHPDTQVLQSMQTFSDPQANQDRKENPFVSLMSLAVQYSNFRGYLRMIPDFNKPDTFLSKNVEDLKHNRDLTKVLKIEIKRIETDEKFV